MLVAYYHKAKAKVPKDLSHAAGDYEENWERLWRKIKKSAHVKLAGEERQQDSTYSRNVSYKNL